MKIVYPDFFYIPIEIEEERNLEDYEAEDEFANIDQEYAEEESEK